MNKIKALFILGTRPEAIKLAPVIREFKDDADMDARVCVTAQHRQMMDQALKFFGVTPDYDLDLMKKDQDLFDITADGLKGLRGVFDDLKPDVVFVQGDTTTAFIGALAGFYAKAKVAHVEAGLRSFDRFSPYPEEVNRTLAGRLADYHFAPTEGARENLYREGIKDNVFVVGNTVVDALLLGLDIIRSSGEEGYYRRFGFIDFSKKVILVTGHRRESFGGPFEDICGAIRKIAMNRKDVEVVYPVHLNPNVQAPVRRMLTGIKNVHLTGPLDYRDFIWIMSRSYMILTDSGGVQEEAPSLGKPVLVMRGVTERTEGVRAGTAKLVGTDGDAIAAGVYRLLQDEREYRLMSRPANPYGDGKSSGRIHGLIKKEAFAGNA